MNFLDIIKSSVLHTIHSLKLMDVYIGEVIEKENLKIKLDQKLFIDKDEIIITSSLNQPIEIGTKLLILKESGGQRFFVIDSIIDN